MKTQSEAQLGKVYEVIPDNGSEKGTIFLMGIDETTSVEVFVSPIPTNRTTEMLDAGTAEEPTPLTLNAPYVIRFARYIAFKGVLNGKIIIDNCSLREVANLIN